MTAPPDEPTAAAADMDHRPADGILLTTTDTIPGYDIVEVLGLVRGNTIRVRHVGNDILAGLKTLVGGEIAEYTKMMAESREQSLDRLRAEVAERGGNAAVALRFTTSTVMAGAAEILAYATAVKVKQDQTCTARSLTGLAGTEEAEDKAVDDGR